MEKIQKQEEKETDIWTIGLAVIDENTPPLKVFVNNESKEQLDRDQLLARLANNMEKLMKLL